MSVCRGQICFNSIKGTIKTFCDTFINLTFDRRFNSIKGTIKTRIEAESLEVGKSFNSIKGTIKTESPALQKQGLESFNSIKGTIKTGLWLRNTVKCRFQFHKRYD